MKILCCSDTHGKVPGALAEDGAAAWLHAGDFNNMLIGKPDKERKHNYFPAMSQWLKSRKIPIFAVHGNHDCCSPSSDYAACCIDKGVARLGPGWLVVGLGWSGQYFYDLPLEKDMSEVCLAVEEQVERMRLRGDITSSDKFVVLTHYPPYYEEYQDLFTGSREGFMFDCISRLVAKLDAKVVIQGHVHELFGISFRPLHGVGPLVFSPGPEGGIVELNEDGTAELK